MLALVIDDSRAARSIIGNILKEIGMSVLQAANGLEALETLQKTPGVELLLVDWNMPAMNGLEFIKAVRADPTYQGVRVLMVTSEAETSQVKLALESGADEYLMKPFTKDVLVAKLNLLDVVRE
jgi:two-component system chemotaxis response regulator CheY